MLRVTKVMGLKLPREHQKERGVPRQLSEKYLWMEHEECKETWEESLGQRKRAKLK